MTTTEFQMVYVSCSSAQEAGTIALKLVEEKLIACANVIPGVKSYFSWEDQVKTDDECILIGKGPAKNAKKIITRVKEMHSYDTPCIVFYDMTFGNRDYLSWIADSTRT